MTRLNTVRNINEQTRALVMKGERQLQSLGELCGKIGGLSFAARPSRVTEIEYGLILELQQTRNQLTMLQNELARQESMIREKMQEQYGDKTHQLSMEILHTTNRITDAKDRMKEQVSIRYHSIRREMLDRMVQKGSAPYNIKRKAMLQVAEEEKVMKQEKERLNLKRTILHMETLFKMKALASQKQFQYEMNLVANKIRAHQNLSTQIKNYKSTESVLQQETTAINLSLAKAKTMMRSLEAEVELSTREHQRLLAWQKNQSRVMSEMKTLADRFDRVSDIDFQKLEMTLSKKSMESERSKRHETHGPRRQRIIKSSYQKQIQQLDRLVYEEEKIIDLLSDKTRAVEKMLQQPADTHAHAHTHIGEVGMTLNVDVNRDSDNDGGRGQWSENNAENVEVKPNTTRRVNTFRKDGRDTENKNKNENENENENPRNGPSVHSNNPLDITQEEHGDYKQSKQELAYSEAHYRELVRENQRLRRQLRETEPTQANDHIKNQLSNSQHYYSGSADNSGGFPLSRASMFRAREKKRFNTINHPGHDRSSRRQRKPVFESQRLVFHK